MGRRITDRTVRTWVAVAVLAALPLAGCGTRESDEAIARADGSSRVITGGLPADGATTDVAAPPIDGAAPVEAAVPGTSPGTALGTATQTAKGGGPKVAAPGTAPVTTPGQTAPGKTAPGNTAPGKTEPGKPAAAAVATGADAPCTASLAPIILGQTSPSSGIIGASTFNMRAGLALWAKAVNARGGVQCHPITLLQMDDGADPSRVTSNLTAMKAKGAVAMVGVGAPTTFPAAKQFAEKNKIPFVGGDLIEAPWFSSSFMFPQGGAPLAAYAGAMKEAAKKAGTKKVGLVYCVEAAICGSINENFEAMAEQSDLEVVLRKVSSITSPDYTAECQALKAAGAEAVFIALEGSGDARFSRSCLSLDYAPPAATSALSVSAEAALDPNFRKLGVFLGTGTAPYQATDTAGGREFRAAYDRFTPGGSIDQNTISQWASGKLFEKALENVFAKARSGPITGELILEGLWQIKNEKLDGLAPGVTFNKGAPPDQNNCYALLNLTTAGYTAPKGSKFECFPTLPRGF
ncbi:MAG: ABC transporter substrate-binding protein [Sporichthyaceae bacterium]